MNQEFCKGTCFRLGRFFVAKMFRTSLISSLEGKELKLQHASLFTSFPLLFHLEMFMSCSAVFPHFYYIKGCNTARHCLSLTGCAFWKGLGDGWKYDKTGFVSFYKLKYFKKLQGSGFWLPFFFFFYQIMGMSEAELKCTWC